MHDAEIRVKTVVDTNGFTKLKDAMANVKGGLNKLKTAMKNFGTTVKNAFKSAMVSVGNFATSFLRAFLKVDVIATIVASLRKSITMLKEGLENYAQASPEYNKAVSELKSNLEQLKNSLATAFAPIIQMVIPYLNQFLNWLNMALEKVAMFFAVVSGKNYYLKAKKQALDYAKSLKKVKDEAKGLAGFDQLNVLNSNSGSDDSGDGALNGSQAFEKVTIEEGDIPEWMQWVVEHLELIKELAKDIGILLLGWTLGGSFGLLIAGIYLLVTGMKEWIETGELSDEVFARLEIAIVAICIALSLLCGSWIPLAIGAVVALALAIYKNWDKIKEWCSEKWEAISSALKKGWESFVAFLKKGVSNIKEGTTALWNFLLGILAKVVTKTQSTLETLKSKFTQFKTSLTNIFTTIWENVKKVINNIIGGLESMINGFITAINKFTSVLGNIANYVGDKLGLDPIDLTFDEVHLPRLATGGIVTSPTRALIGESGREAVLPLENNTQWMDILADKISQNMEVTFRVEGDPNGIFKVVRTQAQQFTRRTGQSAF